MRTCFVPSCDVRNKDQPNRTMFLAPKERTLFAQWSDALPKVRKLKSTDKVCYLHFKPDEVLYTFDHIINGQIIKLKRDRPRLKPNAVPCLEVTTEEPLSRRVKNRLTTQSTNVKISENTEKKLKLNSNIEEPEQLNDSVNIYIEVDSGGEQEQEEENEINNEPVFECDEQSALKDYHGDREHLLAKANNNDSDGTTGEHTALTELTSLFSCLYENDYEILMPTTLWGIHRCPQRSFVCFSCLDALKMQVTKMLTIKDDGSVQLLMEGHVKTLHLLHDIDDIYSLSILLNKMEVGHLCFGKSTNVNCDFIVEPNDDNCWFTDDNQQVFLCKFCLPRN